MDNNIEKQFTALLEEAEENTTRLSEILKEELRVLSHREFEQLATILSEKISIAENIEEIEKKRSAILSNLNLTADKEGTIKFITECESKESLLKKWDQLQKDIENCQMMNQANKMVVDKNQAEIQRILEVISGQQNNYGGNTYSKNGTKSSTNSGNEISKA